MRTSVLAAGSALVCVSVTAYCCLYVFKSYVRRNERNFDTHTEHSTETAHVAVKRAGARSRETLAELLTLIFTTSPVKSNPSTELLEATISTFSFAPELYPCPKVFVCDGFTVKKQTTGRRGAKSYRAGVITEDHVDKYEEFKRRLRQLVDGAQAPSPYQNSTVLELESRQGFGFAVKAALAHVHTPYVIVVQHDRSFRRDVCISDVVEVLRTCKDIKMISLLTRSTMGHPRRILSRCQQAHGGCRVTPAEENAINTPRFECGHRLVPMLQWLDSTHVAKTEYYRNFVFGGNRVAPGGFIEDKLGNLMLDELRAWGFKTHRKYGTWIWDDGSDEPMVGHWHGRCFLTTSAKSELRKQNGKCASASVGNSADSDSSGVDWSEHVLC